MNRFTKTEKWTDPWFRELSALEKLVWFYICDNCDNAGIIEIDYGLAAFQIGCTQEQIEGALKGLARGLLGASRINVYRIRTFLKHQKNENLNPSNKAHVQILRIIAQNKDVFPSFYAEYKDQIEGATKGLQSPTGIGIGNIDISKDSTIGKFVELVRQSHPAFADKKKLPDITIINSLRTQPDREKWKPAIETMARHYAGAEMRKPCGHLENYLYGKSSFEQKPKKEFRGF